MIVVSLPIDDGAKNTEQEQRKVGKTKLGGGDTYTTDR